jgi:hypothetical protein
MRNATERYLEYRGDRVSIELVAALGSQVLVVLSPSTRIHPRGTGSWQDAVLFYGGIGEELSPLSYSFRDVLHPWDTTEDMYDSPVTSLLVPGVGQLIRTLGRGASCAWKSEAKQGEPRQPTPLYDSGPAQFKLTLLPGGKLRATSVPRMVLDVGVIRHDDDFSELFVLYGPYDTPRDLQTVELYVGELRNPHSGVARRQRIYARHASQRAQGHFALELAYGTHYTPALQGHPATVDGLELKRLDPLAWEAELAREGEMRLAKRP